MTRGRRPRSFSVSADFSLGKFGAAAYGDVNSPSGEGSILGLIADTDTDIDIGLANGHLEYLTGLATSFEADLGPFGLETYTPSNSSSGLFGLATDFVKGTPGSGLNFSLVGPGAGAALSDSNSKPQKIIYRSCKLAMCDPILCGNMW